MVSPDHSLKDAPGSAAHQRRRTEQAQGTQNWQAASENFLARSSGRRCTQRDLHTRIQQAFRPLDRQPKPKNGTELIRRPGSRRACRQLLTRPESQDAHDSSSMGGVSALRHRAPGAALRWRPLEGKAIEEIIGTAERCGKDQLPHAHHSSPLISRCCWPWTFWGRSGGPLPAGAGPVLPGETTAGHPDHHQPWDGQTGGRSLPATARPATPPRTRSRFKISGMNQEGSRERITGQQEQSTCLQKGDSGRVQPFPDSIIPLAIGVNKAICP